jgi:outer membrane protein TolC
MRMDADIASIDVLIDRIDKKEKRESFLLEKLKKFVDLAYAQEQKSINEQHLILAAENLELTKKKYEASIVDRVDVLLQEESFIKSKQQLLQSEQDLILLQHEIAVLLDLEKTEFTAEFDLFEQHSTTIVDLKGYIFGNSRVGKIADLNEQILRRQQLSLNNKLRPELDFNLGFSSESNGTTYLNVLQGFNPAITLGLDLKYPLGNTKSISSVAKNQVSIDRLEQQKQDQLLSIYLQAKVLREKITLLSEMMDSNRAQIDISKERTSQEKYRYANSQGQASLIISSQNNEQSALLSLAKTAKNYQKTVLDYMAAVDKLLP